MYANIQINHIWINIKVYIYFYNSFKCVLYFFKPLWRGLYFCRFAADDINTQSSVYSSNVETAQYYTNAIYFHYNYFITNVL